MNLTSTQKLIIVIVAIVVVAAAVTFLLIVPRFAKMATLDSDIAEAELEISRAQSLLEQRQAVKARAAETESRLLALSNEVPEYPQMPELIIALQDTVNTSGMEFLSLQPAEPEVREGGYTAVASDMIVQGRWQDCVDLLQRLRRMTRQVRIVEFSVVPIEPDDLEDADAQTETVVEATVLIEVYTMAGSEQVTEDVVPPSSE